MTHAMEPVLFEQTDPRERGRAHGELWRDEIAELAQMRRDLVLARSPCASTDQVTAIATLHLDLLRKHASNLGEELLGIAEGAARSAEDIVVLNGYADLRRASPGVLGVEPTSLPADADLGGATTIYFNTLQGPVLGQTWDLHATAEPFLRMIRIKPDRGDSETLCLTVTGCLGMGGIGQNGVTVTTNHLSTTDTGIGLIWPALVRGMLETRCAADARKMLDATPLSSGHYFTMADGIDFFGIECSAQLKVLTQTGPKAAHLHTDHCFDPVLRQREAVSRKNTTFARLNMATTLYAQQRPSSVGELWDLLGSHDGRPTSICSHADEIEGDPDASKTCARLIVVPRTGEITVGRGCSDEATPLRLSVERFSPRGAEPG